jgi:alpha-tubulin suppressor-like RCC1 family protein
MVYYFKQGEYLINFFTTQTQIILNLYLLNTKMSTQSTGGSYTMEIKNGDLRGRGFNRYGQLGDGTNTTRLKYTKIVQHNVRVVACGSFHTMIIKKDGTLWGSGGNSNGQLGTGTFVDTKSFVKIMDGVDQVSCGFRHTIVLKGNEIWTFGANNRGQLGDGTITDRNIPVCVCTFRDHRNEIFNSLNHYIIPDLVGIVMKYEAPEVCAYGNTSMCKYGDKVYFKHGSR